ncbi:MAG: DUF3300 domain-containing protein [Mangrovicoccus sp.]|nr:DUF3300 domain-containing protein [Mangrovicoccus sp.]
MRFEFRIWILAAALALGPVAALSPSVGLAQEAASEEASADASAETAEASDDGLLTEAELENLVAPVALYPDTLLIQILVAATEPLEVIKADNFLDDHAGEEPEALKPEIDAMGWDPSVAVLAQAFPSVIADMATHVEWTETMGAAMLAQSDDVMNAVQVMRDQAVNSGALVSGEQMTVVTDEEDNVVVTPTDPEVVYVPEYDPDVVYAQSPDNGTATGSTVGDAVLAGAVGFGTFALLDAIFDNDDDWNNYWGCRNCGGWGGAPIIRSPNVDIDVDKDINIAGGDKNISLKNREGVEGWKPDPKRSDEAKAKLQDRREGLGDGGGAGSGKLPVQKPAGRSDDLRAKLSERSGAADISDGKKLPNIDRAGAKLSSEDRAAALRKTAGGAAAAGGAGALAGKASGAKAKAAANPGAVKKAAAGKKPAVKQAAASKKAAGGIKKPAAIKKPSGGGKALKKSGSASKIKAAGARGKVSRGGGGKLKRR